MNLKNYIPIVDNFPKPGISFLDITGILENPEAFRHCVNMLSNWAEDSTSIVAIESRGFPFAGAVAKELKLPLILVRKQGKLPRDTHSISYDTEYSTDTIEINKNAIVGKRPFIIDDLLATGGTLMATANLIRNNFKYLESVSAATIINLKFLPGEKLLLDNNVLYQNIVDYD